MIDHKLMFYLTASESEILSNLPDSFKISRYSSGYYAYRGTGSPVLAVAHLDTVLSPSVSFVSPNGQHIHATALDDRLGAYIILEMLPRLNINVDVLLTTNEEIGRSTGEDFAYDFINSNQTHTYNWMVEFDRRGEDVATYQYRTPEFLDALKEFFPKVESGSFTDITSMSELGICGFNVAIGYKDEHWNPTANLNITKTQVNRFIKFFKAYKDTLFPYRQPVSKYDNWAAPRAADWYDWDNSCNFCAKVEELRICEWCNTPTCANCLETTEYGPACPDCASDINHYSIEDDEKYGYLPF